MECNERIYEICKKRNWFEDPENELRILKDSNLEKVIIVVERGCNSDRLSFRYSAKSNKFFRVILTEEDMKYYDREKQYKWTNPDCIKRGMKKRKFEFEEFLNLINQCFEPIKVYEI